jgi:hypothetical protein
LALSIAGCTGNIGGSNKNNPAPQNGQLAVTPSAVTLRGTDTQMFAAEEGGSSTAPVVTWSVNGTAGGNSTVGTISADGLYSAPEFPPTTAITISAVENSDSTKTASSAVTVNNPIP